jgi:AraC family transcriptional regulator
VERVEASRPNVRAVKAAAGGFSLQLLRFERGHRLPWFEPEWGYLAIVLDGAMQKRFTCRSWSLRRDAFATLPAGAAHYTDFGTKETHVLTIFPRSDDAATLFSRFLAEPHHIAAPAAATVGRRIACELELPDASSALAAEGLVLQLLALGEREKSTPTRTAWLATVAERLHAWTPSAPTLTALAAEVGVHPAHLARSFRHAYGMTVCEYSRVLRLEWAAAQLREEASLAQVAVDAGFADQSHFTRSFRRHFGVTPGRYRRLLRD